MNLTIPVHEGMIYLEVNDHPTIFEIGVHHMEDTPRIKPPESNFYAFEPDPRNVQFIKDHNLAEIYNVKFFDYAIGDTTGLVDFYLSDGLGGRVGWSFSSSMREPTGHLIMHPWCTFQTKTIVQSITLDDFCKEQSIDFIDFIWMDVQGCEDLVFQGGRKTLSKTKYLFTEFANEELYKDEKNLETLLNILGPSWSIQQQFTNDVLLIRS